MFVFRNPSDAFRKELSEAIIKDAVSDPIGPAACVIGAERTGFIEGALFVGIGGFVISACAIFITENWEDIKGTFNSAKRKIKSKFSKVKGP